MPFKGHPTPSLHHSKGGTSSTPLPPPPPIPESITHRDSLSPSSAPSTPYSDDPSQLFYRPPPSSPVPVPAMPAHPPTALARETAESERASIRMSGYASSTDGSAFLARLPEGMERASAVSVGAAVWRADGLSARVLAEILSPRSRRGSASTKSGGSGGKAEKVKGKKGKGGGKSEKGKGNGETMDAGGGAGTVATAPLSGTFSTLTHTELNVPETPPPVPPKPLAMASPTPRSTYTAHTARTYSSYSHSSHSGSINTEHGVTTAQHATRTAATSHHLTSASLASLSGIAAAALPATLDGHRTGSMYSYHSGMAAASESSHCPSPSSSFPASTGRDRQRASQDLAIALASLPWAEPPARQPSPLFPSPREPGMLLLPAAVMGADSGASRGGTPPGSAGTPTYSFLADDPAAAYSAAGSHSRRSSASSTVSRRAPTTSARPPVSLTPIKVSSSPAHDSLPSGVPVSPSLAGHSSEGGWGFSAQGAGHRRFSAWSTSAGGSGDAAAAAAAVASSGAAPGVNTGSPSSAMATQASSSNPSCKPSSRSTKSARLSFASATRTKSTKSTKSTRSTKRGSGSTLGHKYIGRWEVRRWEEIGEEESREGDEGEGGGSAGARREETMDLRDLVGRAVVLERMLRSGRRVSAASMKRGYKESRFSISSRFTPTPTPPVPAHRPSFSTASSSAVPSWPGPSRPGSRSAGPYKGKGRPSSQFPSRGNSTSTAAGGSSRTGSGSGVRAKHGSMPASLRERISRRLMRSRSQEDVFTELGSTGSASGSETGVSDGESGDEGMRAAGSGVETRGGGVEAGSRGSRRVSKAVGAGAGAGSGGEEEERGDERVGGKGVLVFPEELEAPPTPPKDQPVKARVGPAGTTVAGHLLACTSPHCISPSSPTPLLSHLADDPEKGLRHPEQGNSPTSSHASLSPSALGAKRYEQSPHLGHRSPNWLNRQSVLSYMSTKVWDPAVGRGATVWDGKGQRGRVRRRRMLVLGLGAVVLVVLIVGLLAGLLSKRGGEGG